MGRFENDSIFWIEVDKIVPNPYQPRRDFDEEQLRDLADSIRQYGVLQPLTVTRNEKEKESGGIEVEYELIAGERRHRAAKMAGLSQVPAIIRSGEETSKMKLELAIIENLQREDLNPIERAQAFQRLNDEFDFKHTEIAEKIGKSREYVSNSIRLLKLPENMQKALMAGKITEGHSRPLMMLRDNPDQQETLFKEIIYKDLTVREAEEIARRIARDKVRNKDSAPDPETVQAEEELSESLGTRVRIKRKEDGGKLIIDFFSEEDLEELLGVIKNAQPGEAEDMMERYIEQKKKEEAQKTQEEGAPDTVEAVQDEIKQEQQTADSQTQPETEIDADVSEKQSADEDGATKATSVTSSGVKTTSDVLAGASDGGNSSGDSTDNDPGPEAVAEELSGADDGPEIDPSEAESIADAAKKRAASEMDDKEDVESDSNNTSEIEISDEQSTQTEQESSQSTNESTADNDMDESQREEIANLISDHFGDEVSDQVMEEAADDMKQAKEEAGSESVKQETEQVTNTVKNDKTAEEQADEENDKDEKDEDANQSDSDDEEDLYSVSNFSV